MSSVEKLQKLLQDIAKKEDYLLSNITIKPISSEGANYTTDLFLATISEPPKPDVHLFAKVSNIMDANARVDFMANVYITEGLFYSELTGHFERIYNKYNVPHEDRLRLPKYYGHVSIPFEETMILENLEVKGFKNFDRMKTFNWEYAAAAVTQLARFHAIGLAFREENPMEYDQIISNFTFDFMTNSELMEGMMTQTFQNIFEILNDDHKIRLQNYFSSKDPMALMGNMMQDKTLLIHGDFRPSNLMHKRRNGKLELITLDYQMLRLGSPLHDLMYFVFSGSDAEFRRLHYQRLMDHYFTQLTLALQQLHVDVENVYPRKTFDKDLIEKRPSGLLIGLTVIGMVTVAPEDAPQFDGDIASIQVKPNELAQQRISGIIEDFIRWGEL